MAGDKPKPSDEKILEALATLTTQVKQLVATTERQENKLDNLSDGVKDQSNKLTSLERKTGKQETKLDNLSDKANDLNVNLASLRKEVDALKPKPTPADPDPAKLADDYRKLDLKDADKLKKVFNAEKPTVLIAVARLLDPDDEKKDAPVLTAMYKYVASPELLAKLAAAAGKPVKA